MTFSTGKDNAGTMASPFCTPLEQPILRLSPESDGGKNGAGSFALALGGERCRLFNGVKRDGACSNDGPVSCLMVHPGAYVARPAPTPPLEPRHKIA